MIRTVKFKSVFDAIARRHGMDPRGDAILSDAAMTITERINARVNMGWRVWEWPQITLTEERAYRQIWSSTRQFSQVGENNKPDEVFYIPNVATQSLDGAAYYRVLDTAPGDPPIGDVPTDTAYWEPIDNLDRYISLDQPCKRPIGEMLGIYSGNPRITTPKPLAMCVSEKGIDVYAYNGLTVFVKFLLVPSRFTALPYIDDKTYNRGDIVYRSAVGECFYALATSSGQTPESSPTYWLQIPMPDFLSEYVKCGVYSDGLRDTDHSLESSGSGLGMHYAILARQQKIQALDAEADNYLEREIDWLRAQGQHFRYPYFALPIPTYPPLPPGYWLSPPWTQGTNGSSNITTLTEECECNDFGYQPPQPTKTGPQLDYESAIISITGPEPSLISISTVGLPIAELKTIVITVNGSPQDQSWRLDPDQADPADPGQAQPNDWDLVTNNKHWQRVD